jgi:hypothetical protein
MVRTAVTLTAVAVTLAACAPTMEMREGADRQRLLAIVERFCAAERSPDPDDSRALLNVTARHMLEALPSTGWDGRKRYLTSVDPEPRCEPGRTWYLGGSRMFAEVRLARRSDKLDLWRGEVPLITNIRYGRGRRIGAAAADDLREALMLEFALPRRPDAAPDAR